MIVDYVVGAFTRRRHPRHRTDIPFDYSLGDIVAHRTEYLTNVSLGGLCFRSKVHVREGTRIKIQLPIVNPVFKEEGEVMWCRKINGQYSVGVKFLSIKSRMHARMFEQVCFIEQYKLEVLNQEGRELSSEEAGIEWISKYAKYFDI